MFQKMQNLFSGRSSDDDLSSISAAQFVTLNFLPAAKRAIDEGDYERADKILGYSMLKLGHSDLPAIQQVRGEVRKLSAKVSAHFRRPDANLRSGDHLNAADIERRKLANEALNPIQRTLIPVEIIKQCQLAILKDMRNGDAHVLLAHAYLVLALWIASGDIHAICMNGVHAVLFEWKFAKLPTVNQKLGNELWIKITDQIKEKYPQVPIDMMATGLRGGYADSASPGDFNGLESRVKTYVAELNAR